LIADKLGPKNPRLDITETKVPRDAYNFAGSWRSTFSSRKGVLVVSVLEILRLTSIIERVGLNGYVICSILVCELPRCSWILDGEVVHDPLFHDYVHRTDPLCQRIPLHTVPGVIVGRSHHYVHVPGRHQSLVESSEISRRQQINTSVADYSTEHVSVPLKEQSLYIIHLNGEDHVHTAIRQFKDFAHSSCVKSLGEDAGHFGHTPRPYSPRYWRKQVEYSFC
jgi:hypothetical protein